MRRSRTRYTALLCLLLTLATVGGAFGLWFYATEPPAPKNAPLSILLSEFTWEGSDILPDDIEGEDHGWLINNLVSGEKNGTNIGLDNPNSDLNEYISDRLSGGLGWKRDYFGSMAVTGDEEMEALFGAAAEGLSFIIQVKSDTEYYVYTTSVHLGQRGEANWLATSNKTPGKPSIPIGEYIYPIYRTKLTRPNTSAAWDIVETKAGKAKSDWYDENRRNANITQIPAFDINTWVEAELGTAPTVESAIRTFVGDDPAAYPATVYTPVYYRITDAAGTRRVTSYNTNCTITVYDASGNIVASTASGTDGSGTPFVYAEWTASAGTTYYFSVSGSLSIPIAVS